MVLLQKRDAEMDAASAPSAAGWPLVFHALWDCGTPAVDVQVSGFPFSVHRHGERAVLRLL
jgi:hypothetical protein